MNTSFHPAVLDDTAQLAADLGNVSVQAAATSLAARLRAEEWLVVLLGQTSSGKSSWINALLGDDVLPVGAGATTSAAVEVRFTDAESYEVLIGGAWQAVSRARFQELCRAPDVLRLRMTWPASRARAEAVRGLVLLDTPGYDACVDAHGVLLSSVLPEADAVLLMLSHKLGVTAEDKRFVESIGRVDTLIAGANFIPELSNGRRLAEMQGALDRIQGGPVPLHPLKRGEAGPWSDGLWRDIARAGAAPGREEAVSEHARELTLSMLAELEAEILVRSQVVGATEAQVERVREAVDRIGSARERATGIIATARRDMLQHVDGACLDAAEALWREASREIDAAGRFTDATTCAAFVTEHVIPGALRRAHDTISIGLSSRGDVLGAALDGLHAEVEGIVLPPVRLDEPAWAPLRDAAARRTIGRAASGAFGRWMKRLGGAAGEEAGLINVAKMALSRGGRLVGKTFSVDVYYQMGATLRRIGLRASSTGAALGAVAIEAAAYVYQVVRWKQKLRAVLQRLLGVDVTEEPIEDAILRGIPILRKPDRLPLRELQVDAQAAVTEALAATEATVDANFSRRAEVLRAALAARSAGPAAERERIVGWADRAAALTRRCSAAGPGAGVPMERAAAV